MEALGRVIERLLKSPGGRERLKAWSVLFDWEEVVGEELAKKTWPLSFSHGKLTLGVTDPAWASALRFEGARILELLNQAAGEKLFTSLRFVIAPPPRKRRRSYLPPLSPEESEKVRQETRIEDAELRELFIRWREVLLRARKRSASPPENNPL